jgi:tRNA(Ile2) C34 agmatinyltransferase TiaS
MNEIEIGGRYVAKVSGKLTTVRVTAVRATVSWRNATRQVIDAVNETTGRKLTFRSAQRLRRVVKPHCELCRQPTNRPAKGFTCPHCQKVWKGAEAQP